MWRAEGRTGGKGKTVTLGGVPGHHTGGRLWTPPTPTTRENETLTNKDMPCLPDPQRPMEALTRSKGRSSASEQRKPCCHERSDYLLQLYHQPGREREQLLHHSLRKFHSNSNSAPKQTEKWQAQEPQETRNLEEEDIFRAYPYWNRQLQHKQIIRRLGFHE